MSCNGYAASATAQTGYLAYGIEVIGIKNETKANAGGYQKRKKCNQSGAKWLASNRVSAEKRNKRSKCKPAKKTCIHRLKV